MKVAVVLNQHAGDGESTRRDLLKLLEREGYQPVELRWRDLTRRRAADLPGKFVVIAGGDGSVKRAMSALAGSGRPLAILPTGTANNIAHSLGIIGKPEKIIAGWRRGERVSVDVGVAEGPWGKRYFIESIGAGLIGRAIAIMDRIGAVTGHELAAREDRLFRDLCVLLALTHELQPVPMRIVADGRQPREGNFLLCEVLNIRRSGPGVELSRSADPADGCLDLISVEASERHKLLRLLERCLAGKKPAPLLRTHRVKEITLTCGPHELRVDDQVVWPPKRLPEGHRVPSRISVKVSILPGALECMLPKLKKKHLPKTS